MTVGIFPVPFSGIQETLIDAKGDLLSASAADTPVRLAVGTNNHILTADSAEATGLKWAAPASASGPACHVYRTGDQTLNTGTYTKIQYNAEGFDTDNNFDSTTNYRFTASKAGYYQINLVSSYYLSSSNWAISRLYFNGSAIRGRNSFSGQDQNFNFSALVYMNGSSDYLEGYAYGETGGQISGGATIHSTYFDAVWIRS